MNFRQAIRNRRFAESLRVTVVHIMLLVPLLAYGQTDFTASPLRGCDTLTVQFTLITSISSPRVRWDFGNGQTSSLPDPAPVKYTKPGKYSVELTVNDTVVIKKTGLIQVRPSPSAYFTYSDSAVPGSFIYVFRSRSQPVDTAVYNYVWRFQGQNVPDTTPRVVHAFDSAGIYRVALRVTDDFGCSDSVMRRVIVSETLYVPNVFTPNEDGLNDYLEIPVNGETLYRLQIFSRYGILVFKTESKFPVWDGRSTAGVKMSEGIYYYVIESLDSRHPAKQSGFVYLLR